MSFLDKFLRKQKEEKLEKQAEKASAKDLEFTKKTKPESDKLQKKTEVKETEKETKEKEVKKETKKEKSTLKKEKKESVKIGDKGGKKKFKIDTEKVLVKPLITEKVSDMAVLGKYVFKVKEGANKIMVKKAIGDLYNVKVADVKIINTKGKRVRYGRQWGRRAGFKKAIVTLAPGEKIEVYEGV